MPLLLFHLLKVQGELERGPPFTVALPLDHDLHPELFDMFGQAQ